MKISTIYKQEAEGTQINLCQRCGGKGWYWSNLDFGDIPGDEEEVCCDNCAGTGRIKTVRVVADIIVPFNWSLSGTPAAQPQGEI